MAESGSSSGSGSSCGAVDLMVVYSENHATKQMIKLPPELDALGPKNELVKTAVVAAVCPMVSKALGFAFAPEDISGVRWTPEPPPGVSLSKYANEMGGKLHLLFINPERGAIGRVRNLAGAVMAQGEQLKEKDEEIARLKQELFEAREEITSIRAMAAKLALAYQKQQKQLEELTGESEGKADIKEEKKGEDEATPKEEKSDKDKSSEEEKSQQN